MSLSNLVDVKSLESILAPLGADMSAQVLAELQAFALGQSTNILTMTAAVAKALLAKALEFASVSVPVDGSDLDAAALAQGAVIRREAAVDAIIQANAAANAEIDAFWQEAKKLSAYLLGFGGAALTALLKVAFSA